MADSFGGSKQSGTVSEMADQARSRAELVDAVLAAGREVGAAAVFFHSAVAARFGFGPTDVKVLDLLQRHGPMTPKTLGELTSMAPASITGVTKRLGDKGFVRLRSHPDDGRRRLIEFDPTAMAQMGPLYAGLQETLTEMLDDYTDDELAVLARGFADAARRQHAEAARITGDT